MNDYYDDGDWIVAAAFRRRMRIIAAVLAALLIALLAFMSNLAWDNAPDGTEIITPNREVHP